MFEILTEAADQHAVATAYTEAGWHVFPVRGKQPLKGSNGLKDAVLSADAWDGRFDLGVAVNCGRSGMVVIDCDGEEGRKNWTRLARPNGFTGSTTLGSATPRGGRHWFFRLPPGVTVKSRNAWMPNVDVKSDGGYVVLPSQADPARQWINSHDVAVAPEWLIQALEGAESGQERPSAPQARTMLSRLLQSPPKRGDGQTNEWCIRVFGHYAQRHRNERDLYEVHCLQAMALVDPDYEDYDKCLESAWTTEQEKTVGEVTREVKPESGWLIGSDHQLWCRVNDGDKEHPKWVMRQWADFDMTALGVTDDEDQGTRTYDVELRRMMRNDSRRVELPASALADPRALTAWLVQHGVTCVPPSNEPKGLGAKNDRLLRYLEAQDPPRYRSVPSLGWHHGEFLSNDEILFPDGPRPFGQYKPNPNHRSWSPFEYGYEGTREEAIEILREVLTFHDPDYVAVFASWWAACFLKPRLPGQFPYLLIEAPSGHGKTTGFNPFMLQLAGNTLGQIFGTTAAIRDYLSGHNSGPVWVDDLNDTAHLEELLRQMTNSGAAVKKGEDRTGQVASGLVAPLILSGEGFPNLQNQRAQLDRAVLLSPPNPTGRRSLRDPSQPQWADIEALQRRFPDGLHVIAGHIATAFLTEGDRMLSGVRAVEPGGRFKEKLRVLRFGAELLSHVVGDDKWMDLTDVWCRNQTPVTENVVTLKVIPAYLRQNSFPDASQTPPGIPANACFVRDNAVYVNTSLLADWWAKFSRSSGGNPDPRTESGEAFLQQLRVTDSDPGIRCKGEVGGSADLRYWRLTPELSAGTLARAQGASVGAEGGNRQEASVQPGLDLITEMDYWVDPDRL